MKKILMVIFVLLFLGMGSYIVYDKITDEECNVLENAYNEEQLDNNVNDDDDDDHWVDYLLSSNITSAQVNYCDENDTYSSGMPKSKELNLTKDELSQLLLPLKEKELVKVWLEGTGGGGCSSYLVVNYLTEREDYVFIYNGKMKVYISDGSDIISPSNDFADVEFLKIIENSDYTLKFIDSPEHTDAGALYSLWTYDYDANIFDLSNGTPLYKIVESKK